MRTVVQRVTHARVEVEGQAVGEIGPGLLVFLGIHPTDGGLDIEWLAQKILQLRIFADPEGKMNLSLADTGGGVLIVSQFTLYASTKKGNRPSFTNSAPPSVAIPLYEQFVEYVRARHNGPVATGIFGADMKVSLLNDGPVTIVFDTHNKDLF